MAVAVSGGHSGHAPQRPITGTNTYSPPPNRSLGLDGPLAEVDFFNQVSGPRRTDRGPAGTIRALQNEPRSREMDPQDESGPRKTDQGS